MAAAYKLSLGKQRGGAPGARWLTRLPRTGEIQVQQGTLPLKRRRLAKVLGLNFGRPHTRAHTWMSTHRRGHTHAYMWVYYMYIQIAQKNWWGLGGVDFNFERNSAVGKSPSKKKNHHRIPMLPSDVL